MPFTVCCNLATWSRSKSLSKMPPHKLQQPFCSFKIDGCSSFEGVRRSALISSSRSFCDNAGIPSPLHSIPLGRFPSHFSISFFSGGSSRMTHVPLHPSFACTHLCCKDAISVPFFKITLGDLPDSKIFLRVACRSNVKKWPGSEPIVHWWKFCLCLVL